MPIVRTLKNGQWAPCTTIDNLPLATQLSAGLMSSADKNKLDSIGNKVNLLEVDVSFSNGVGTINNSLIKSNSHCLVNIITSSVTSVIVYVGACTNGSVSLYAWNADSSHVAFTGTKRINCLIVTPIN